MATTCELIAKTTLGSSATNIEFTSIPGTGYTDLLLVCSLRSDRVEIVDTVKLTFNGSGSNYSDRGLQGSGAAASSWTGTTTYGSPLACPGSTATSSTFSNGEIYIPNYAGSTNKSMSATNVTENNATNAYALAYAGLWSDTAAITSIKLAPESGTNFVSGSSAFLYGITKA